MGTEGSRPIEADWWRVDPPDIDNPFWIHGHVSFRHDDGFVGMLLGFYDGRHAVSVTDDETQHKFVVMALSSNEDDDSAEQKELCAGYVRVQARWPGSRGNPIPEGVEILDKGLFWWAPSLNFLVDA